MLSPLGGFGVEAGEESGSTIFGDDNGADPGVISLAPNGSKNVEAALGLRDSGLPMGTLFKLTGVARLSAGNAIHMLNRTL